MLVHAAPAVSAPPIMSPTLIRVPATADTMESIALVIIAFDHFLDVSILI